MIFINQIPLLSDFLGIIFFVYFLITEKLYNI